MVRAEVERARVARTTVLVRVNMVGGREATVDRLESGRGWQGQARVGEKDRKAGCAAGGVSDRGRWEHNRRSHRL
jgi:hypothetical protein